MDPNELVLIVDTIKEGLIPSLESCALEIDKDRETIQTLEGHRSKLLTEIDSLKAENSDKQKEIDRLELALAKLTGPPPPPLPPIEVSPDITISLGDDSFRPDLKGERQGNETRYRGSLNSEVDVLVDIKDDGQIAVCLERSKSTLLATAPVIDTRIAIEANGIGESDHFFVQDIRLHHHTRPRIVLNPSKPPKPNAKALISSRLLPNFDLASTKPTEDDLARIAKGSYPWETWQGKMAKLEARYDSITEEYGQVVNSWTGGAGPLMNEAAHLMPVQLAYLASGDERAWPEVVKLANSSGNYAIHYQMEGGRFPRADETGSLPFLQGDSPVTLKTADGVKLPVPEPAHEHNLVYLAYLLTGERWYREELEAWCTYNLLTRPKNDLRLKGVIWSGQIRAAAWSLRALLHTYNAASKPVGRIAFYSNEIIANLMWMNQNFVNPDSSEYLSTGVCSLHPFRSAPLLDHVTLLPKPKYFATWNHHILASVLNECVRAGFNEAVPMRDHLTRVVQGQWQYGQSRYDIGWGNHAFVQDNWKDIVRTTFEGRQSPSNSFPAITTPDYVAWARSSVVAAVDAGQSWARGALEWIDREAPKYKGGIPAAWRIDPS